MLLTAFRAERFRNLGDIDLALPAGMTVVGGGNGQGKTGLLEGMYLLGTGRSFRTRRWDDLPAWDGGPAKVAGRVEGRRGNVELAVRVEGRERTLLVNGAARGQEAYLGRLDVVDLTEGRMDVLRGGPAERRRFLDRGIAGLFASHLRTMREYRLVLQQRNALLRGGAGGPSGSLQLDSWDERMVAAARPLHLARRAYAERLAGEVAGIGPELLPDGAAPRLEYRPSPPELREAADDRAEAILAERLARCRERDREHGHTTEGPHRDDLRVELREVDLRRFGSAGQVRAAMIALKLGKLSLLQEEREEAPLFLLDDFDTDLDDRRMEALAGHLNEAGFQTVAATSKEDVIARMGGAAMKLHMDGGAARTS